MLADECLQVLRVGEVRGQRLVADDVDAGLDEGAGDREVQVVRRDDRHRVDAVAAVAGAFRLGAGHLAEVAVAARRVDPQFGPAGAGAFRIGRQRTRDQFPVVVEPRRNAVHGADERALPTADHAQPQTARRGDRCAHARGSRPSIRRLVASSVALAAKSSKARSATRIR